MMTTLSLWLIYFASYLANYCIILGILIWKHANVAKISGESFWKDADFVTWGILIGLITTSILISLWVNQLKMNTRVKFIAGKNITIEMLGYIAAQIFTAITTIFTNYWIPINILIFIIVGVIFVKSGAIHHALLFVFPLGNRIYESGEYVIISNFRQEEMRIAQEDELEGLQARELTKGVYYIRKK